MADPTIDESPRRRSGPHAPLPTGEAPAAPGLGAAALAPSSEDDSRARAARRAAQLREHQGDLEEGPDKYYIDPRMIPDGWSYEWKTQTVLGQENPSYQVSLARKGWEAVPRTRHPEMMPANFKGAHIERDGQILMERPLELTNEAKARDLRNARDQVRQKEAQLHGAPAGEQSPFANTNKGTPLVHVTKSYEPMPIPKE